MINLTNEQKDAIRGVIKSIKSQQIVTLSGYAGTGKSTCLAIISKVLPNFAICAYTGKACNVLRKKGLPASTIHSIIYKPISLQDGQVEFVLKDKYEIDIDGFIIDEASMVSKEIHEDLCSYGLPIIYVGDHGQLEPIGTDFNLMKDPKYKLETIHRNAGEIAHFAEHLRKGKPAVYFNCSNKVQIVQHKAVENRHFVSVDQVICAYNKTRVEINEKARIEKNINFSYVAVGDKIICLRNNKSKGLFNGMQGIVKKIRKNEHFDFISDGQFYENIRYNSEQFGQETNKYINDKDSEPFDYAYCITCHKAQGDQFNSLIVIEQRCNKWDHARWSYTAASRAINSLIWVATESFMPNYLA